MVFKLAAIFAMFAGLVTYAQSEAVTGFPGPSREGFEQQLKRAGYVKIDESGGPKGLVVETFELHTPSKPHYHLTAWVYLTSRGKQLVRFDHDEAYADASDSELVK